MSLLVEAISVVILRSSLEKKYPGGTSGFLCRLASQRSSEHRYVCSDSHLVCRSYFTPVATDRSAEPLLNAGLTDIATNVFIDFAIVDQHYGPALQCSWLAWNHEPGGYTHAWL